MPKRKGLGGAAAPTPPANVCLLRALSPVVSALLWRLADSPGSSERSSYFIAFWEFRFWLIRLGICTCTSGVNGVLVRIVFHSIRR